MELLYKYYSDESKYAFNNLKNSNITFCSLDTLNDPFEGIGAHAYQVSDEEQKFWDYIDSDMPDRISKKISEDVYEAVNFKYCVFCTAKEYDNPLLWAYYANSHKGFCVGYKKNDISSVATEIFNIDYEFDMCSINEFNESTFKKLLSVKSIDWIKENECRAIYEIESNDISFLDTDVYYNSENQDNKKIYFHTYSDTLCADKYISKKCKPAVIYLGMKMHWMNKRRLVDIAKELEIPVYQMLQKQNSFNFISEEIHINKVCK